MSSRILIVTLLFGWLASFGSSQAVAAEVEGKGPLRFHSYLLELPGRVVLSYYEDIDRDGLVDILAIHADEELREPPRHLVVFFQTAEGFHGEPDLRYRIPDDVSLLDIGEVDPESPGQELLMLHGEGVDALSLPKPETRAGTRMLEGHGQALVRTTSLFARANLEELDKRDFARAVDEADAATLFIPRPDGYRLYFPDDGYAEYIDYDAHHMHSVSEMHYASITAELHLGDIDGDGHEDLITAHRDQIRVHHQREGRFHTEPDLEFGLDIITDADWEKALDRRGEGTSLDQLVGTRIDDFDGDGLADLFVWKQVVQKKAVIDDKQQYQLYRNKSGHFELLPDQAFILKSFDRPAILDLNGDDRLDMITGYFEFSVGNLIKALLSRRFVIDLSFFLYQEDGFGDQPDETRDVKIRFSLSDMDENFTPAVEIEGDFNGDGSVDFLLQTEDEKVTIYAGTMGRDRLFEKKPSIELKTPASNWAHVDDFNGDGLSDVAFDSFPDRKPFEETWINVLLSRRQNP